MSISLYTHGFTKTEFYLRKLRESLKIEILNRYGRIGVKALKESTPVATGKTADAWSYKIENTASGFNLSFYNSNVQNGVPIATIIQYGHGTGTGGYVQGRDYINPALQPVFDNLCIEIGKELRRV